MQPSRSHDATAIAGALRKVGFQVVGCGGAGVCLDVTRDGMDAAIREFGRKLQTSAGAIAFVYYSGHGVQTRRAPIFEGHAGIVYAVAVLPDGRIISGSQDQTVRAWDPVRGAESMVFDGHTGVVVALAALPDGRVASGSLDHTLQVWQPGQNTHPLALQEQGAVRAIAVLPDGRIVSGANDHSVRIWSPTPPLGSGSSVFWGHSAEVYAVAVLPDGRIASGGLDDGTVRVWDPTHGAQPIVFQGPRRAITALAVLRDGRIVAGSWDGTVEVWSPTPGAMVLKGHSDTVDALMAASSPVASTIPFGSGTRLAELRRMVEGGPPGRPTLEVAPRVPRERRLPSPCHSRAAPRAARPCLHQDTGH